MSDASSFIEAKKIDAPSYLGRIEKGAHLFTTGELPAILHEIAAKGDPLDRHALLTAAEWLRKLDSYVHAVSSDNPSKLWELIASDPLVHAFVHIGRNLALTEQGSPHDNERNHDD